MIGRIGCCLRLLGSKLLLHVGIHGAVHGRVHHSAIHSVVVGVGLRHWWMSHVHWWRRRSQGAPPRHHRGGGSRGHRRGTDAAWGGVHGVLVELIEELGDLIHRQWRVLLLLMSPSHKDVGHHFAARALVLVPLQLHLHIRNVHLQLPGRRSPEGLLRIAHDGLARFGGAQGNHGAAHAAVLVHLAMGPRGFHRLLATGVGITLHPFDLALGHLRFHLCHGLGAVHGRPIALLGLAFALTLALLFVISILVFALRLALGSLLLLSLALLGLGFAVSPIVPSPRVILPVVPGPGLMRSLFLATGFGASFVGLLLRLALALRWLLLTFRGLFRHPLHGGGHDGR
mmetsp:Transcript_25810/g.56543  ORF Transcript_25810/g.56543 Transcript_25810/m.56543 type:complete len:342 (+) Transcript_25810:573-1598(+)